MPAEFDRLPHKNAVTRNAIIAGYAQEGMGHEALNLYRNMQQEDSTSPNFVTFVCLLQASAGLGAGLGAAALHQGKQLHAEFEQLGVQMDGVGGSSLVNMYAKCGTLEDAQRVFDTLLRKGVVTWTAMVAGYAQQGMGLEALSLYSRMQEESITPPYSVTFVCLLQACAIVGVAALPQGKELHVQIEERGLDADVVVGNSLVNMYAKCGRLEDGHKVFDRLLHRDVVTWNAMIIGYSQKEMGEAALNLYSSMQQEGITPHQAILSRLLYTCPHMNYPQIQVALVAILLAFVRWWLVYLLKTLLEESGLYFVENISVRKIDISPDKRMLSPVHSSLMQQARSLR